MAELSRRRALSSIAVTGAAILGAGALAAACDPLPAPAASADPLLTAVNLYRRQVELHHLLPDEEDDAIVDAQYELMIKPHYELLKYQTPAATTEAGAIAALKLSVEEARNSYGSFERPLAEAALAFFMGRAS